MTNFPTVFSQEEIITRNKIHLYLNTLFIPKEKTEHFFGPLSSSFLKSCLQKYDPALFIDIAMLDHLLLFGGYSTDQKNPCYHCDINLTTFNTLNEELKTFLLNKVKPPILPLICPKINQSNKIQITPKSIELFYQNMVFTPEFEYWNLIPRQYNKTPLSLLYEYYQDFCEAHNFTESGKRTFSKYFKEKGHKISCGTYDYQAGQYCIYDLCIPTRIMQIEHKELNSLFGLFQIEEQIYFNDGSFFELVNIENMQKYIKQRSKIYEQTAETQRSETEETEEERTASDNKREDESPAISIEGGESRTATEEKQPIQAATYHWVSEESEASASAITTPFEERHDDDANDSHEDATVGDGCDLELPEDIDSAVEAERPSEEQLERIRWDLEQHIKGIGKTIHFFEDEEIQELLFTQDSLIAQLAEWGYLVPNSAMLPELLRYAKQLEEKHYNK